MRILTFLKLVFASILFCACTTLAAQEAALVDELEAICPDDVVEKGVSLFNGDAPRGVPAAVHVLITGLPPAAVVKAGLCLEDASVVGAQTYRLIPVPVEQNTGLNSRTEIFEKKENPHVIRRAPFEIYEALEPVDRTAVVGRDGVLALRMEIFVPADAEPGDRRYTITLESGDWRCSLPWQLRVHAVTVPPTSAGSRGYTNWFSPDLVAERHNLTPWSEPFWQMLTKYADLMARGRQNTFWIRWSDFVTVGAKPAAENGSDLPADTTSLQDPAPAAPVAGVKVDTLRLKRYIQMFLRRGFTRIEGGHIARRHAGDWSSPRLDVALTGTDSSTPEGRAQLAAILGATHNALAASGFLERVEYLQHIADEPTDTNAETYGAIAALVREHIPGVKIFEATMSRSLVGAVDHWCPQIQKFQQNRDFFESRREAGDKIWVYTCLVPGGPWLNRLLDQERLRPVCFGWALEKYDLAGFLHWGLNHYRPGVDPFEQSVVPHGKGSPNFLPAGDSHVVYPGEEGPLSGLRFEAHRIGMEDAELLRMVRESEPEKAGEIIALVFRAFDDYEKDVGAYRAARRRLFEALAE
jgi:hypothetical protein